MRALAALPVLLALLLAIPSTVRESCTVDEFGNLPLTIAYWDADALHIDRGNPPLTRWIQGLGLRGRTIELGASAAELGEIETSWDLGYLFEAAHRDDYHDLLVRARFPSVALLLLTVFGVFQLTREMFGRVAALGSAFLAASSPNLLAHGRLVTPDIGLTAFVVWTCWATMRASRGGLGWVVLASVLAALSVLAKFSGLLLAPIVGLALVAARDLSPGQRVARAAAFGVPYLVVLFAAWGFPEPGTWNGLLTPLPAPLVTGLVAQFEEPPYPAYLLGENRVGGWPWYYVVALLVKTPLPTLILLALTGFVVFRDRPAKVWLPATIATAFFVAFGFGTEKNIGVRYLLPIFPLLFVVVGAVLESKRFRTIALVLVALSVGTGAASSRHPLAFFNGLERFAGGKRAVLVDSNLDWGQALPDLKAWMKDEGIETIPLAYFGRIDPSVYGISWRTLEPHPPDGPAAISATLAVGRPYFVLFKPNELSVPEVAYSDGTTWEWTRSRPPDEELGGGAILVWKDASAR